VRDVYRYVLAVLRNPADAEDVTQTTFMNAYRAFKRGERPEKPQNWLITIAHNACRTKAIRSSRRPREVPLDDVVTQLAVPDTDKPNIRELLKALGALPFNQRAAIAMRELEGRSYDEIADTLDVSVPAVEALLVRARRTLRAQRTAVRGLVGVQLPRSLRSLFESSDATTTAAGGLVGGGALAKAAAVIVAGVVAGGVGYTGVEAGVGKAAHREPMRPEPRAPMLVRHEAAPVATAPAKKAAVPARPRHAAPAPTKKQALAAPARATSVSVVAPGAATAPVTHGHAQDVHGRSADAPGHAADGPPQAYGQAAPHGGQNAPKRRSAPGRLVHAPPAVPGVPPVQVPTPALPHVPQFPPAAIPGLPEAPALPKAPDVPDLPKTPDPPHIP
jgi:RNA polymerase sigma factor (sigma-70 family)